MATVWALRVCIQASPPTPAALPLILPVVLAQNAQRWNLDPRFAHLLDLPEADRSVWWPFVPDFHFALLQLADLPLDALPGTPSGVITLRVLKAERLGRLLDPS